MPKLIDSITGKTHAVSIRNNRQEQLRSSIAAARFKEIRAFRQQIEEMLQQLGIGKLERTITGLEASKSISQSITTSLVKAIDGDATPLVALAKDSNNLEAMVVLTNYQPLHLLVALYTFNTVKNLPAIKEVLQLGYFDYEYEAYGVVPVVEILQMGEPLRTLMRERLLLDIVQAIEDSNFTKVQRLLDYDPKYLANAIIPNSDNLTIIFYAAKCIAHTDPKRLGQNKFINKLLHKYKCDSKVKNKQGKTCFEYAAQYINSLSVPDYGLVNTSLLGINGVNFASFRLNERGVEHDYYSFFIGELTLKIRNALSEANCKLSDSEKKLLTVDPQHFALSPTHHGLKLTISNCSLSDAVVDFLHTNVLPIISDIQITDTAFSVISLNKLISALVKNNSIHYVSLQGINLSDAQGELISQALKNWPRLYFLDLRHNKLTGTSIKKISNVLSDSKICPDLEYIYFDDAQQFSNEHVGIYKSISERGKPLSIFIDPLSIHSSGKDPSQISTRATAPSKFFGLFAASISNKKIHDLRIVGVNISLDDSNNILRILNNNDVRYFELDLCNIAENAKPVIASIQNLSKVAIRAVRRCNTSEFFIDSTQKTMAQIEQERMQNYQLAKQEREQDLQRLLLSSAAQLEQKSNPYLLSLGLTSSDLIVIQDMLGELTDLTIQQAFSCLTEAVDSVMIDCAADAVERYTQDVRSDVEYWHGSELDLHLISRILRATIVVYDSNVENGVARTYSFDGAEKKIMLLKQGRYYYACTKLPGLNSGMEYILPNITDDLNLFRACLQGSAEPWMYKIDNSYDKAAIALRFKVANWLSCGAKHIEEDFQAAMADFMEAKTDTALHQATLMLPQLDHSLMIDLVSSKRILLALPNILAILAKLNPDYLTLKINSVEIDKIMVVAFELSKMQKTASTTIDLSANRPNNYNLEFVESSVLQQVFEQQASELQESLDKKIKNNSEDLSKALEAKKLLEQVRDETIQKITQGYQELEDAGMHEILDDYRTMRRKMNQALIKAGLVSLVSLVGLQVFGEALKAVLITKIAANPLIAEIAASSVITTAANQGIMGGNAKDLVVNLGTSFASSYAGAAATTSITGKSIYNLPKASMDATIVKSMHSGISGGTQAVLTGKNPAIATASSVLANATVGTAAAKVPDSIAKAVATGVSVDIVQGKLAGKSSHQIAQNVIGSSMNVVQVAQALKKGNNSTTTETSTKPSEEEEVANEDVPLLKLNKTPQPSPNPFKSQVDPKIVSAAQALFGGKKPANTPGDRVLKMGEKTDKLLSQNLAASQPIPGKSSALFDVPMQQKIVVNPTSHPTDRNDVPTSLTPSSFTKVKASSIAQEPKKKTTSDAMPPIPPRSYKFNLAEPIQDLATPVLFTPKPNTSNIDAPKDKPRVPPRPNAEQTLEKVKDHNPVSQTQKAKGINNKPVTPQMHEKSLTNAATTQVPSKYKKGLLENTFDFFIPPAHADELGQTNNNPPTSKQTKCFSLPSALPKDADNSVLKHTYAFGRGIEKWRDGVVDFTADAILHPIDTTSNLATTVWDGVNAIGEETIGLTTAASQLRNQQRGRIVNDTIDKFANADSVLKTEMATEFGLNLLVAPPATAVAFKTATKAAEITITTSTTIAKNSVKKLTHFFDNIASRKDAKTPTNTANSQARLQLEKLRTQYRQQANWVHPSEIVDPKLRNIVDDLYRPNAKIGSGSTADAVRLELAIENKKVGGRSHKIKAENSVRSITDMLHNNSLSAHDRMIAENVRLDLLDSLGEKLWYSKTNTPKY